MSKVAIELEIPDDLARFRLPAGVNGRLQELLDRQDKGVFLSAAERQEAEGLVNLAEFLSLLRLRAEPAHRPRTRSTWLPSPPIPSGLARENPLWISEG
jgi:hypothetical protein